MTTASSANFKNIALFLLFMNNFTNKLRSDTIIVSFPKPYIVQNSLDESNELFSNTGYVSIQRLPISFSLKMCKVVFIGDSNVGKTSIIHRFAHDCFKNDYKATIGVDFQVIIFKIMNMPFSLQIWDTAGQEKFKSIACSYYRSAHAIVNVYDATNKFSLNNTKNWMTEALRSNDDNPLLFLVGNKIDNATNDLEEVKKDGLEVCNLLNAEFWAVSAKTNLNIVDLFRRIAALCFNKVVNNCLTSMNSNASLQLGHHLGNSKELKKESCNGSAHNCRF